MNDDRTQRREAAYQRRYRSVKIGYVTSAVLFTIASTLFILAIAGDVGVVAGVGGIFLSGAVVAVISTGMYHNLSGLWSEQLRRQRDELYS